MTKKDYIYISIIIVLVVGFFLYTKDLREREATCSKTFETIWDEVQKENKNN
jgi:hypothetical protein